MFVLFFVVHGDVAVEIFKRTLLPSFWFILFHSGYENIIFQVYSFSRYSLSTLLLS